LEELCLFPNVKNDDQVDSMSAAINNFMMRGAQIKPPTIPTKVVGVGSGINNLFNSPMTGRGRGKRLEAPR
jgi:hypothetical protein